MDEVEARSLFIAFHLEVLEFGAHAMRVQVVSNDIKSTCIWHRWKWKFFTRKHNKQCSCGALSKAARALEMLNFTPLNGKPIRIMYPHRDPSVLKSGAGNIFIKDIVEKLLSIVHMGPRAVSILSAAGSVATADIRPPGYLGSSVLRCELLCHRWRTGFLISGKSILQLVKMVPQVSATSTRKLGKLFIQRKPKETGQTFHTKEALLRYVNSLRNDGPDVPRILKNTN